MSLGDEMNITNSKGNVEMNRRRETIFPHVIIIYISISQDVRTETV